MKRYATLLNTILLIFTFSLSSLVSKADGVKGKAEKVWTRWELSPSADIYYRVEVIKEGSEADASKTIAVEFLNNYKKDVSFCFSLNDTGKPNGNFQPVMNLKKKKTTVVDYPKDAAGLQIKMTISSLQLEK